ncbi:MAG: AraC family transcriptional regulator [Clostridiaceae bacterium]|nr:AraC family transcriptional regulator [Clostridiaceae bacterium]
MESSEHYHDLSDIIVDFLDAADHRFTVNLHYHNGYELFFFRRAQAQLLVNNQVLDITDGDWLLINPFVMHTAYQLFPGSYARYYINISSTQMDQALLQLGLEPASKRSGNVAFLHIQAGSGTQLEEYRMLAIHDLYQKKPDLWQARLITELALLLTDLTQLARRRLASTQAIAQDHFRQRLIYRLLAAVDEHFRDGLSLLELEQQLFVSRYHICRLFKQETGLTLSQYVNRKRVSLAQQLLKNPELSSAMVCREVGFLYPQHFTSVFRQITGMTPSHYRKTGEKTGR